MEMRTRIINYVCPYCGFSSDNLADFVQEVYVIITRVFYFDKADLYSAITNIKYYDEAKYLEVFVDTGLATEDCDYEVEHIMVCPKCKKGLKTIILVKENGEQEEIDTDKIYWETK